VQWKGESGGRRARAFKIGLGSYIDYILKHAQCACIGWERRDPSQDDTVSTTTTLDIDAYEIADFERSITKAAKADVAF
jgi:hypothetical protein